MGILTYCSTPCFQNDVLRCHLTPTLFPPPELYLALLNPLPSNYFPSELPLPEVEVSRHTLTLLCFDRPGREGRREEGENKKQLSRCFWKFFFFKCKLLMWRFILGPASVSRCLRRQVPAQTIIHKNSWQVCIKSQSF